MIVTIKSLNTIVLHIFVIEYITFFGSLAKLLPKDEHQITSEVDWETLTDLVAEATSNYGVLRVLKWPSQATERYVDLISEVLYCIASTRPEYRRYHDGIVVHYAVVSLNDTDCFQSSD